MKNSKDDNPRISEGIILALASASSYLFAFYYERGYASTFNIPTAFINVSLTSILTFGTILISLILFLLPLINLFLSVTFGRIHPVLLRAIFPIFFVFIILVIPLYFSGISNLRDWYTVLIVVAVFSIIFLGFPYVVQPGKTFIEKLEGQENTDRKVVDTYSLIQKSFGNSSLLVIILLIMGVYIAQVAGNAEARKQEEFLVTNTTPELVVLRVYGDNLICAPFDRTTGEIEQSFSVIKNSGENGLVLTLEKLGRLHLPKPITTTPATASPLPSETLTPTIITTP